ncbi:hypothetical protein AMTR_s00014p00244160 [Amborella trichopoda]|uniref:Uncharacterized protein n=1 Tax=Amborella trichopoda TaxID=13333 RepID=W1PNB9_AMBTC|nr:hypothetical protein AMTR_s00014p00244160 [Amborella trichopoda]
MRIVRRGSMLKGFARKRRSGGGASFLHSNSQQGGDRRAGGKINQRGDEREEVQQGAAETPEEGKGE